MSNEAKVEVAENAKAKDKAKPKKFSEKVLSAAKEYIARKNRKTHPAGYFDDGGRWFPLDAEECDCCAYIRTPSRAYPYSLISHCRSSQHVASLFKVDELELKRAARKILEEQAA